MSRDDDLMMEEVAQNLYVGDDEDCQRAPADWAVVHACKHDCHQKAVGYSGSLDQSHPEYLVAYRETDLYLNIVDMERKFQHEYTEPIVSATLDFIDDHRDAKEVLVHCNQGRSRSPALAMLYQIQTTRAQSRLFSTCTRRTGQGGA